MQKIKLICVGNIKEKYFTDAIAEYKKRLTRFCDFDIVEIKECLLTSALTEKQVIERESEEILSKISGGFTILFDLRGTEVSSEEFSDIISDRANFSDSKINLIIGGSNGVSEEVLRSANKVIRVGKMTFPHQLMRVFVTEQLYRAETIINHIKYHK